MQPSFQSIISKNQFSLPVVCLLSAILWLLSPTKDVAMWEVQDYGLWYLVPTVIQQGLIGRIFGLALTAIVVYSMVEFSNTLVLLRVSSRMLSTTLAILMAICLCLHKFQPAHIAMIAVLFSYLYLFTSYQNESPALCFSSHLFIVAASLFCPKLIIFIVPLWIFQISLSAFNFKCFIASLLAIMTPYWFFFAIAVVNDRFDLFIDFFNKAFDIVMPNFSILKENQVLAGVFVVFLFIVGVLFFVITKAQDKLRQRVIYNIVTIHGAITIALSFFMPQCYNMFLGILIVDTSIIGGRFLVVSDNKFSNNLFVILSIFAVIIYALSVNM